MYILQYHCKGWGNSRMIKVMIIDDEPFIREGLKVIIDWEMYGFQVCEEAGNGNEAIEKLGNSDINLVIVDIRMPQMDGLEFIRYVRENIKSKIKFIVLSGYSDFDYAKQAIRHNVSDYLLKPLQASELIAALEKVKDKFLEEESNEQIVHELWDSRIKNSLQKLLLGIGNDKNLMLVRDHLEFSKNMRYTFLRMEYMDHNQTISNLVKADEVAKVRDLLSKISCEKDFYLMDPSVVNDYTIELGILLLNSKDNARDVFILETVHKSLNENQNFKYNFYVGVQVDAVDNLYLSYKTAQKASVNQVISGGNAEVCCYNEYKKKESIRYTVSYSKIEKLIQYVKENQRDKIKESIQTIFCDFQDGLVELELIQTNVRFILYSIVDMAIDSLGRLEQEEISQYLNSNLIEQIAYRANIDSFIETVVEFADYLYQLKNYSSAVVLTKVNKEIEEHYMENLSLKSLSKKYYINNVYLGQVFKKEKGMSFKEYLNKVRIDKAAEMLLYGNERIYTIAEKVGYQNPDYFISKFVQVKGTTPHQYRLKKAINLHS